MMSSRKLRRLFAPTRSLLPDGKQPPSANIDLARHFSFGQWNSRGGESISGDGSTLFYTEALRKALPIILSGLSVQRLLDAPCGDHNWMGHVDLSGISYLGLDIVPEIIHHNVAKYASETVAFRQADITKDALPDADLMICRDLLMHLPYAHCWLFLENFARSNISYLLLTTHANAQNQDIATPSDFRLLNMRAAPFTLPDPMILIHDWVRGEAWAERHLGLWSRSDIAGVLKRTNSRLGRS